MFPFERSWTTVAVMMTELEICERTPVQGDSLKALFDQTSTPWYLIFPAKVKIDFFWDELHHPMRVRPRLVDILYLNHISVLPYLVFFSRDPLILRAIKLRLVNFLQCKGYWKSSQVPKERIRQTISDEFSELSYLFHWQFFHSFVVYRRNQW